MGTSSSSLNELSKNESLLMLSGKQAIPLNDPFWNQLLSFSFKPPRTSSDCRVLEENVLGILSSLLTNNPKTGNYCTLIKVFLSRASELKASLGGGTPAVNNLYILQTYNILLIIRLVTKYFVQTLTEDEVVKHFQAVYPEGCPEEQLPQPLNGNLSLLERLLTTLIEIIVDVPFLPYTYGITLEAVNTLLVLLSVQMFSSRPASKSLIYRTLLHGKCTIHAPLLMKTLLQHFIAQEKWKMLEAGGGSIILGLASGIWNVLTLGYGSGSSSHANVSSKPDDFLNLDQPLSCQSLLLTLVLANHCTNDKAQPNPYRLALISFTDIHADCSDPMEGNSPTFRLDFQKLYHILCSTLRQEVPTLLLYLLLHRNANFHNYVLSRSDMDTLLIPLLKVLYHSTDASSHHIYMVLIILLILSEDDFFNSTIHDITLKNIPWYTERSISEISLGGLLVVVLLRTIQYNMTRMRDKYLHTNCLAALANMSSHFRNLHPYVCQKFVSLFEHLAKRLVRLEEQIKQHHAEMATMEDIPENSVTVDLTADMMQDVAILEEVVRMVLEILVTCLGSQLSHNPNLIYSLLYRRAAFEALQDHPALHDLLHTLLSILSHFSERLEQEQADKEPLSVAEVSTIIQQTALQWPQDKLKKFMELKFKYVEEEQPEEFFIPYIWTLIYSTAPIYWSSHNIVLFTPQTQAAVLC